MGGHGIKKETYVNADEKTTKSMTFDLLEQLGKQMDETQEFHVEHLKGCGHRFKDIEDNAVEAEKKADKRAKRDTAAGVAFGFIGGYTAVATTWLKKTFMG